MIIIIAIILGLFVGVGGGFIVLSCNNTSQKKASKGQFSLSLNCVNSDAGQKACRASRDARARRDFRVSYKDGSIQTFNGFVSSFATSGAVDGKVDASMTIEIDGEVTMV